MKSRSNRKKRIKTRIRQSIRLRVRGAIQSAGLFGGEVVVVSTTAWRSPSKLIVAYPEKAPQEPVLVPKHSLHQSVDLQDGSPP